MGSQAYSFVWSTTRDCPSNKARAAHGRAIIAVHLGQYRDAPLRQPFKHDPAEFAYLSTSAPADDRISEYDAIVE